MNFAEKENQGSGGDKDLIDCSTKRPGQQGESVAEGG